MSRATPAHVRRAEHRADSARDLQHRLVEHDTTQLQLAAATGRTPDKVQRVCDPERTESLSVIDVRLAREAGCALERVALDCVRWQLGARYAVATVPQHRGVSDDLRHLAELVEHSGELAAHVASACADGLITADEAAIGLAHCEQLLETVASARERFSDALAGRGDVVRRLAVGGTR